MRSSFTPTAPAAATIELPPARATDSLGPPGSGGSPGFASVLHDQVARTASAEGQNKTATETGGHRARQAQRTSDRDQVHQSARRSTTTDGGAAATHRRIGAHQSHAGNDSPSHATDGSSPAAGTAVYQMADKMVDHPGAGGAVAGSNGVAAVGGSNGTAGVAGGVGSAGATGGTGATSTSTAATSATGTGATAASTTSPEPSTTGTATTTDAAGTSALQTTVDAQQASALPTAAALLQQAAAASSATDSGAPVADAPPAQQQQQLQTPTQPQPAQSPQLATDGQANGVTTHPSTDGATAPTPDATQDQGQNGTQQDGANANPQDPRAALQSLLSQPSATPQTAGGTAQGPQAAQSAQAAQQPRADAARPAAQGTEASATDTSALNLTTASTPLGATTAPAGTPAAAAARYAVPLERAVETVQMTVEAAARQGFSQARIQLSPEAFGGIKIDLQHTSEGLVAKVVTDHEAAAQTLAHGGAELKRSLEAAGVNLVRLDVEARGDSGATSRDPNHPTSQDRTGTTTRGEGTGSTGESDDSARVTHTLVLPSGAHVNVLA